MGGRLLLEHARTAEGCDMCDVDEIWQGKKGWSRITHRYNF